MIKAAAAVCVGLILATNAVAGFDWRRDFDFKAYAPVLITWKPPPTYTSGEPLPPENMRAYRLRYDIRGRRAVEFPFVIPASRTSYLWMPPPYLQDLEGKNACFHILAIANTPAGNTKSSTWSAPACVEIEAGVYR